MPETEENQTQTEQQQEQQEEAKTEGWDKDRQKIDQLSANVTKLASDKSELIEQISAMNEQSQGLAEKLKSLEQQLATRQEEQQKEAEDSSLDPDMYDAKLIKKISGLESAIGTAKQQLEQSQEQVKTLLEAQQKAETEQKAKAEELRKAEVKEKILSGLDERYGAKYRNEALKLTQAKIDETGKAPEDALGVYLLLEKQYIALSKNAPVSGEKQPSVTTVDTGEGGVVFNEGEIKEGSREEVLKNIWSKFKDKSFTMPST